MTTIGRTKTLKDVSRASGLSLITVSRALRRPETVQAATRQRVLKAIEAIGYVPNLTARSLVSSRSNMVGVVVPILSSSLFSDFAQGVATVLQRENLQMLLGVSQRSVELEATAVRTFVGRQADAIIMTGFTHADSCRTLLTEFNGPVVETWNLRDEAIDIAVGYDNFKASADMTRYLLSRGYRTIALVGGDFENNDQAVDRYRGFMVTMAEAGRSVRPEHIVSVSTPTTMESGGKAMLALMAGPTPPDAVFFHAEIPAHGAFFACLSNGINVPGDVAIAGFGDLNLSPLLPVPMTTVHIKAHEMGVRAAERVVARLGGTDATENAVEDLGYEIMRRQSA